MNHQHLRYGGVFLAVLLILSLTTITCAQDSASNGFGTLGGGGPLQGPGEHQSMVQVCVLEVSASYLRAAVILV